MFLNGRLRQIIDAETRLAELERHLGEATDLEHCWSHLRRGSMEFGFKGVRLVTDGTVFAEITSPDSERFWQLRIPLQEGTYVNFLREFDSAEPLVVSAFANSIQRGMIIWLAAHGVKVARRVDIVRPPAATSVAAIGR